MVTFCEELDDLKPRLDLTVVHVVGKPSEGWQGETGYITAEVLGRVIPQNRNGRDYFICGPVPMMDAIEAALRDLGVSLAHIHSERYNFVSGKTIPRPKSVVRNR